MIDTVPLNDPSEPKVHKWNPWTRNLLLIHPLTQSCIESHWPWNRIGGVEWLWEWVWTLPSLLLLSFSSPFPIPALRSSLKFQTYPPFKWRTHTYMVSQGTTWTHAAFREKGVLSSYHQTTTWFIVDMDKLLVCHIHQNSLYYIALLETADVKKLISSVHTMFYNSKK